MLLGPGCGGTGSTSAFTDAGFPRAGVGGSRRSPWWTGFGRFAGDGTLPVGFFAGDGTFPVGFLGAPWRKGCGAFRRGDVFRAARSRLYRHRTEVSRGGARRAGHFFPWRCPVNLFLSPRVWPPRPGLFPARVAYGRPFVVEPSRGNSRPSATPRRVPEGGTPGSLARSVRERPAGPVFPSHALPPFPPGDFPRATPSAERRGKPLLGSE